MAQQVAIRSIQEYPFKVSDKKVTTGTFSGQGTTISGTKFTTGIIINQSSFNVTTTANHLAQNFGQTSILQTFTQFLMHLEHIEINGKMLQLLKPITINATYQDKMYSCQNEELGIVSVSAKLKDCIKDFEDEVLFVWTAYGKEDDTRLTNDAKELKKRILSYIEE